MARLPARRRSGWRRMCARRRRSAAQPSPPTPISSGTSAMLANLSQPSSRSMSSRSARFTSRSSRRVASMSPRNFSIACRSLSLRMHRAALARLLELGELVLHLLELGGERLLLLAVAPLGVAAQLVDELEGAVLGAAAAQRDQRLRARQVVERVDHEGGVAGVGDRHLLAQELAHLDPELVVQQIGVGDDDDVDPARRRVRLGGRGRLGFLVLGLASFGSRPWAVLRRLGLGGSSCALSSALALSSSFVSAGLGAPSGKALLASPATRAASISGLPSGL